MRYTQYYNLNKPENSDPVLIGDINANMDTLDLNLYHKQDELTAGVGLTITKSGTTTTITNTGVPGPQGPTGPSGVEIGTDPPTDPNISVWIDTDDTSTIINDNVSTLTQTWSSSKITSELATKQNTIDSSNKLSADLVSDGSTNKVFTATDKANLNANTSARHTHANKSTLDSIGGTVTPTTLGVDTVVTSGSSNLITSGAVYTVVGNIEATLQAIRGV